MTNIFDCLHSINNKLEINCDVTTLSNECYICIKQLMNNYCNLNFDNQI